MVVGMGNEGVQPSRHDGTFILSDPHYLWLHRDIATDTIVLALQYDVHITLLCSFLGRPCSTGIAFVLLNTCIMLCSTPCVTAAVKVDSRDT